MHPSYYAIIPASVRYDSTITANAKLLYGEITALCNKEGYCWASNQYFAELYGVSKASVSAWINGLAKAGYLTIEIEYEVGTKEIKNRTIYITKNEPNSSTPMKENFHTPMKENLTDNTKGINNKNISKDMLEFPSAPTTTNKKGKEINTMKKMVLAFTEHEDIKERLLAYLQIRLKTSLVPDQWSLILQDLRTYTQGDAQLALEKINSAIAGGYRQIIASWEKEKGIAKNKKGYKTNFDNTAKNSKPEAIIDMNEDERKQYFENLATDEDGSLMKF